MKINKFFITILVFINFSAFANEGFYVGTDVIDSNVKVNELDNSIPKASITPNKYYGYKFSNNGFFVSPEVFILKTDPSLVPAKSQNQEDNKNSSSINNPNIYNFKANIGYEFSKYFSGFLTYDLGKFSYNIDQKSAVITTNISNNINIGIGSKINISDGFGFKVIYNQQQIQNQNFNSNSNGGVIKNDIIKFGTFYNF